jgi:hypothetical protein
VAVARISIHHPCAALPFLGRFLPKLGPLADVAKTSGIKGPALWEGRLQDRVDERLRQAITNMDEVLRQRFSID